MRSKTKGVISAYLENFKFLFGILGKKNYIYNNSNPKYMVKEEECVATRPSVFQLFIDVCK